MRRICIGILAPIRTLCNSFACFHQPMLVWCVIYTLFCTDPNSIYICRYLLKYWTYVLLPTRPQYEKMRNCHVPIGANSVNATSSPFTRSPKHYLHILFRFYVQLSCLVKPGTFSCQFLSLKISLHVRFFHIKNRAKDTVIALKKDT